MAVTPGSSVSRAMALKEYFGLKEGQNVMDFAKEIKALSPEAKEELARGAAKALGVTLNDK